MRINNLRYNGRTHAFEASVDITRDGRTFRYPCEVYGPASMDPALISAGLRDRAIRMSDTHRR
ncbi:hypothetical protein SAMN04488515_2693 [Cognatiyoonia koreensis]|uniref:Orotidine 5'-phosphate decarboxylase n=1 Tax=Cognatiyoonia koreensis TaxID=364200 RepID=A0A1I0RHW4_9RHOB|nr:hypothetical protein [Cognatiyoonia koreensis]SEW40295.1 hypothetical protein SAMN04488515_2693 [Cognatiyoonia koreensis]